MAAENEKAARSRRLSGRVTALGIMNPKTSPAEIKRGTLLAEAAALGKAAGICRSVAQTLNEPEAEGARRCLFSIRAEAQRLLAQLGRPSAEATA